MFVHIFSSVRYKLIALVGIIIMMSCTLGKRMVITQGITGQVTRVSGNQMPMKGKAPSKGKAFVGDVIVFEATSLSQAEGQTPLFTRIKTKEVAHAKTDSTGHYEIALPVGRYSVFIKVGQQLFAAETDGNSVLNPVDVQKGTLSFRNIVVNYDAAY